MSERVTGPRRALPRADIVASVLVAVGVLAWMFVSRGLLVIAGAGAFGPGLLRELGWLDDHDEFQREAARRAGYHAYLAGGVTAVLALSLVEWGEGAVDDSVEWARLVLVVLWLTWLASTLLTYWGPAKTASRVLAAFGSFWAVFVLATLIGDAMGGQPLSMTLLGTGVGILILLPFFGLAWTARRWPRPTGIAMLGLSLIFAVAFARPGPLQWSTVVMTQALLGGPFVACGLALLLGWGGDEALVDDEVDVVTP